MNHQNENKNYLLWLVTQIGKHDPLFRRTISAHVCATKSY